MGSMDPVGHASGGGEIDLRASRRRRPRLPRAQRSGAAAGAGGRCCGGGQAQAGFPMTAEGDVWGIQWQ